MYYILLFWFSLLGFPMKTTALRIVFSNVVSAQNELNKAKWEKNCLFQGCWDKIAWLCVDGGFRLSQKALQCCLHLWCCVKCSRFFKWRMFFSECTRKLLFWLFLLWIVEKRSHLFLWLVRLHCQTCDRKQYPILFHYDFMKEVISLGILAFQFTMINLLVRNT